jgi:two-component system sensor histidine kinase FlrB
MQTLPVDRQKKLAAPAGSAGSVRSARRALAAAFASFTQTAGALETTYTKLQLEVARLRHELERKNRSLAQSLEENQRMRDDLAKIVKGLPCGVMVFDAGMNLRVMNPAASHLLNESSEELCASQVSVPRLLGSLLAALPKNDFDHEQEWVVGAVEGERTLGVTRACLRSKESCDEFLIILRDLTEAKQLEHEREISRRSQALAEIGALLAHEIRNPLGSLELFAGLLADALANQAELQPWINHVQAGLRSLAATVNNVLHFHSQPASQLVPMDLIRVVGETVDFLRPLAMQKEMAIDWQAPTHAVFIHADPSRLQQAFLNLALNAFRAMKPGGTLSIRVEVEGIQLNHRCIVVFADQGTGIRSETLEKIFEPGFSTQAGSPGLGLAVTRTVVEQHGGMIGVESHEGQGTTFTISLPPARELVERDVG